MAKADYNKERWYIATSEYRQEGEVRFTAYLQEYDGTWQTLWREVGFLSRSDARKEAIAKIQELETA